MVKSLASNHGGASFLYLSQSPGQTFLWKSSLGTGRPASWGNVIYVFALCGFFPGGYRLESVLLIFFGVGDVIVFIRYVPTHTQTHNGIQTRKCDSPVPEWGGHKRYTSRLQPGILKTVIRTGRLSSKGQSILPFHTHKPECVCARWESTRRQRTTPDFESLPCNPLYSTQSRWRCRSPCSSGCELHAQANVYHTPISQEKSSYQCSKCQHGSTSTNDNSASLCRAKYSMSRKINELWINNE